MKKIIIIALISFAYSVLGEMADNLNLSETKQNKPIANTQEEPDLVWRYIDHIGWRKFTPLGGAIRDWSEFKKVNRRFWRWQR